MYLMSTLIIEYIYRVLYILLHILMYNLKLIFIYLKSHLSYFKKLDIYFIEKY